MELVLIQPGTLIVGRFEPACAVVFRFEQGTSDRIRERAGPQADTARCEEIVETRTAKRLHRHCFPARHYIGKYEVTQGEWTKVMGSNPSLFQGQRQRRRRATPRGGIRSTA